MTPPILGRLIVWWGDRVAGELAIDRGGAMHFAYAPDWLADPAAPALSQAMPRQAESYGDALCKAVFGGLLPEEGQRTAVAQALGVSPDNPFRLLEALGGDVAGALAFLPEGEAPASETAGAAEPLDESALAALLDRLPRVPLLAGEGVARLSLAGAQGKLPVVLIGGRIAVPLPGQPSTHLIKPEPERFPGLAANEAYGLALAREIGLDAAMAHWQCVAGRPYLLIERYDRAVDDGGEGAPVRRLHQEDFAQALGVPSSRKYAAEGGPGFREAFALVRGAATRPAREVLKLADAALFNLILGNADAHAKNFSLLRREGGVGQGEGADIVLAPLYDLVATHMWPELSPRFAMRFGGVAKLDEVDGESFTRFAADSGLAAPFVKRRARELAELASERAWETCARLPVEVADSVAPIAEATAQRAGLLALKAG